MRIASWNVNSIRARLDLTAQWLKSAQPDVVCLQETKVVDDDFPADTFARLGYEAAYIGQRTYNGVALLSRHAIKDISYGLLGAQGNDPARLIAGTVNGVRILSAYVPNGKTLESPSYVEKLEWIKNLRATLDESARPDDRLVLCGDFNIARDDRDVFDAELMRDKIHFSAPEHAALNHLLDFGLVDAYRERHQEAEKFTWWDYRMGAFRRNRGLRIDYVFATKPIIETMKQIEIDTVPRTWDKPSDHTPVVIDFD
jgi:exodeoxyribonuclease III